MQVNFTTMIPVDFEADSELPYNNDDNNDFLLDEYI